MNAGIKAVLKTLYEFCKDLGFKHEHMIIAEELLHPENAVIDLKTIKLTTYQYFGIKEEIGDSKTRKREIVQARQIAMELAYRLGVEFKFNWSLEEIGGEIGDKDHATVLHAKNTVADLRETSRRFDSICNSIELNVRSKIKYHDDDR